MKIYKLWLTLEDDDGQKVERIIHFTEEQSIYPTSEVDDMINSLEQSKKPL